MLHARQINLSFAMATNQIQQFGLNSYGNARFQLHPPYDVRYQDFFFRNVSISVAMTTNQKQRFGQEVELVEDYSRNISVKLFFQNICSNTEINANFHPSHYKSMETLSCHSNESTWATTIKTTIYVEAEHLCKVSASSPLRLLRRNFLIFFSKIYPLCCHGNQSNSVIWTKFI